MILLPVLLHMMLLLFEESNLFFKHLKVFQIYKILFCGIYMLYLIFKKNKKLMFELA